jgi:uncharacterized membrane protein YjjP (DUF1212 family)
LTALTQQQTFIIQLGTALHQFGTPAYRLESHLKNVSVLLGLKGSFLIMPTALTFILESKDDPRPLNHIVRVMPGDLDLGSLARTDELVEELDSGQRTLEQAIERLEEIKNKPNPYSAAITFLAFGVSGGAFAMLMHAGWNDVLWATLLSAVNFFLVMLAAKSNRFANMLEPLVALIPALLASAIAQFDPSINVSLVVLSAIIIFIPGLALSLGLSELSSRHLVSGTARVMDGLMTMFKLYFGTVLGLAIGKIAFPPVEYIAAPSVPAWTAWLAIAILSSTLVVMFKSRLKDAPWGIISGFLAYTSTLWASNYLDISLSAFVGAFAVGIYSNLFARWMKAPALIVSLQGFVLLVPGSKVYIGLNTMISGQNMVGDNPIGPQTFLIFMSLVAGLIFSNVAVAPKRSL